MDDPSVLGERAHIIRIRVDEGREGLLYATSPDLPGLIGTPAGRRSGDEIDMSHPLDLPGLTDLHICKSDMRGAQVVSGMILGPGVPFN